MPMIGPDSKKPLTSPATKRKVPLLNGYADITDFSYTDPVYYLRNGVTANNKHMDASQYPASMCIISIPVLDDPYIGARAAFHDTPRSYSSHSGRYLATLLLCSEAVFAKTSLPLPGSVLQKNR